jgi:predicted AlkP superfamily pyrophosphatase or phosphodiesterase
MNNSASFSAVEAAEFGPHFRRPLTESYTFAGLPALIRHAVTGEGALGLPADVLSGLPQQYDRVALIFLDAFGWAQAESLLERSRLLGRVLAEGVVSQLTAQFPSTTTAHIATLAYAQPVGQHGLYEWNIYEPALDRLIVPLLYGYAGEEAPNALPLDPARLAPGVPFFAQLAEQGVRSAVAQRRELFGTRSAQYSLAAGAPLPFSELGDGLDQLAGVLEAEAGPFYAYLYHEGIDAASHGFGPASPEARVEVERALDLIEDRLIRRLAATGSGRTLVLITADHGQMTVAPDQTVYVNEIIPALEPLLKRGADGKPLAPAGSSRDLFLHVLPQHIESAVQLLREHPALAERAEVWTTRDLAAAGLFGATSEAFWRRAGDVVVLPYDGQMVWWRDPANPKHTQGFRGHHGGLSAQEMEIPLLALAL